MRYNLVRAVIATVERSYCIWNGRHEQHQHGAPMNVETRLEKRTNSWATFFAPFIGRSYIASTAFPRLQTRGNIFPV